MKTKQHLALLGALFLAGGLSARADEPGLEQLLERLGQAETASAAADQLVARGEDALPQLVSTAYDSGDLLRRGWAIVCISRIGGEPSDKCLRRIVGDAEEQALVRTWAAAGRIALAPDTETLIKLAQTLVPSFPPVGRPTGKRLVAALGADSGEDQIGQLLTLSLQVPVLQKALLEPILALGSGPLLRALTSAEDLNARRQAAAYLGALAARGEGVAGAVLEVYRFDGKATDVPWKGGPLFLPALPWEAEEARALVGNLIRWLVWADRKGRGGLKTQIHNNIRSMQLAQLVGYESPGWQEATVHQWLVVWGKAVGREELERLLDEQGVKAAYQAALNELGS